MQRARAARTGMLRPTMSRSLTLLAALSLSSALAAAPDIYVAYPPENYTMPFDHVLLEGSVPPGASLRINGRSVDTGQDGLFIEWLPLQAGPNVLRLESSLNGERALREFRVTSKLPAPLPATPTAIVEGSVTPAADLKLYDLGGSLASRTLNVSFRGSPGAAASFTVGGRGPYPMLERAAQDFPGSAALPGGTYEGSLVLQGTDALRDAPVVVTLRGADGTSLSATAGGKVSVGGAPRVGIVTAELPGLGVNQGTVVARNGPGKNYILYPRAGEKFTVVGEEGNTYRAQLAPGQTVNLLKSAVRLLPEGAPLPRVYFTRIETRKVTGQTGNFTQVRFVLPDRVPFSVEQTANGPDQHLDVRLYGTESDVDYLVSAFPDEIVRNVRWTQEADGVLRARIDLLGAQQWGFNSFYDGNTLVVQVRGALRVNANRPLEGRRILVDPGHGGSENGGAGALRVNEKDLVLPTALKLAENLRALGAVVTLTREGDVTVPIYERPLQAEKEGAELLVSVHANALPDGADPSLSRGSGVYFFWPQARPLADALQASLVQRLPEVGNDGIHYQNLALTRPSSQLSVLVETAFLTDKGNLRLLMSDAGRERFADAMARGIEDFYRAQAKRHSPEDPR